MAGWASPVQARLGEAWQAELGMLRCVTVGHGRRGSLWLGVVLTGMEGCCKAGMARNGLLRHSGVCSGRHVVAWFGVLWWVLLR